MLKMMGLDFETYSDVDLRTQGLQNYVDSPNFKVLLAAVCEEDHGLKTQVFDMVHDPTAWDRLVEKLDNKLIVAHNAGFEQAVLASQGIDLMGERFVDTAVLARAAGAGGSLEASAAQLLGKDKVVAGADLIKKYCIPGRLQEDSGSGEFDPAVADEASEDWQLFKHYCQVDAELSFEMADKLLRIPLMWREVRYSGITMDMNKDGWPVDLGLVSAMDYRYHRNLEAAELGFRTRNAEPDLNLNSPTQLLAWCKARGVSPRSFDEKSVESTRQRVVKKLSSLTQQDARWGQLSEVHDLLLTKQELGGSSLKKLDVILKMTAKDGRLHDQYLHVGAGATFRTSGRGVQMQNLKRLNGEGDDMLELFDESNQWDNGKLAANLRQVFTATDVDGFLIVGDFSSVESRGLAWQAGEQWKLDAYFAGKDLYKVQAGKIFGKHEAHVTKAERQVGKVGELACGYGAGADAVRDFAAKMGVELSEVESAKLVRDWRGANPQIVEYWRLLDEALHDAVDLGQTGMAPIKHGWVKVIPMPAPQSLRDQVGNQDLVSLHIHMYVGRDRVVDRVIHGAHVKGRNIQYWKPSERKTGDLWVDTWTNPKTKRQQPFTVYGGKLSGLLTQSLCREVFFNSLRDVHGRLAPFTGVNVQLVGQFHDEIVLDWEPGAVTLESAKNMLNDCMSKTKLPQFPLAADIKHDYRYTK
jgi:DNA polymerase